jgi:hypothetical protein
MNAIIIKGDSGINKMLYNLAKKLGAKAFALKEDQLEDFALGTLMDKIKTNELVSKEEVLKKLRKK